MARGFESKDVEFQQAEAERVKSLLPASTPEERARQVARRTTELALASARGELAATSAPVRRAMLRRAIAALEAQLGQSGGTHQVDPDSRPDTTR